VTKGSYVTQGQKIVGDLCKDHPASRAFFTVYTSVSCLLKKEIKEALLSGLKRHVLHELMKK